MECRFKLHGNQRLVLKGLVDSKVDKVAFFRVHLQIFVKRLELEKDNEHFVF